MIMFYKFDVHSQMSTYTEREMKLMAAACQSFEGEPKVRFCSPTRILLNTNIPFYSSTWTRYLSPHIFPPFHQLTQVSTVRSARRSHRRLRSQRLGRTQEEAVRSRRHRRQGHSRKDPRHQVGQKAPSPCGLASR
jgi:hypothetical protein